MDSNVLLTFTLVAAMAVASPGPAILMAINNSLSHGQRSAVWSTLGNASGLFCLSTAAVLGLGALIASSEWLFNAVKLIGAGYLFYLGIKQFFNTAPMIPDSVQDDLKQSRPTRSRLYKSAFLTAVTNPKATMFFSALFPQFIDQNAMLLPQFLVLTLIFIALSMTSLSFYAALASQAKGVLTRPRPALWISRVVGATFICFAAAMLTMRRQTA